MNVLVTGATGRIGRVIVSDLLARNYRVRATTSRPISTDTTTYDPQVDWREIDLIQASAADLDRLVGDCDAVIHLAAEIHDQDRMWQLNVEATRALAESAERANVTKFCYASSVAVYGSGLSRTMTEDSPVLTVDQDVRSEYWVTEYVRTYGRSKLAGEQVLKEVAAGVEYVIFRPTVVVDVAEMLTIRDWGRVKRVLAAHRHAHHIYVRDVSDAFIWAIEQKSLPTSPGSITTYNLSDEDCDDPTHAEFMHKAFAASHDPRFKVTPTPSFLDWLQDFVKQGSFPIRNPLWRMRFPCDRLHEHGWYPKYGMAHAHSLALQQLSNNQD